MTIDINRIASYLVLTSVLSLGGCPQDVKPPPQGGADPPPPTVDAAYRTLHEEQERARNAVSDADWAYQQVLSVRDKESTCTDDINKSLQEIKTDIRTKYHSVSAKGNAFLNTLSMKVASGEKMTPEFKPWADDIVKATDALVSSSNVSVAMSSGPMCGQIQVPMSMPFSFSDAAEGIAKAGIVIWKAYKEYNGAQRKAKAEAILEQKWPSWDIIAKAKFSDIKSSSSL